MDSLKPTSGTKNKLSKTFHKVIHCKTTTKTLSNSSFCPFIPQEHKPMKNRADTLEVLVAKLFATVSAAKTSYVELQMT